MAKLTINSPEVRAGLKKRKRSKDLNPNEMLAQQLTVARIDFGREYKFCSDRKWRADFVIFYKADFYAPNSTARFQEIKVLIDVDGGTFSAGKTGFRVLRFDTPMVRDGIALKTIMELLGIGANKGIKGVRSNHG